VLLEDMMTFNRMEHESTDSERFLMLMKICPRFVLLSCMGFDSFSLGGMKSYNRENDYMTDENEYLFIECVMRNRIQEDYDHDELENIPEDLEGFIFYCFTHKFTLSIKEYNPPDSIKYFYLKTKKEFELNRLAISQKLEDPHTTREFDSKIVGLNEGLQSPLTAIFSQCCVLDPSQKRPCSIEWLRTDMKTNLFSKFYTISKNYLDIKYYDSLIHHNRNNNYPIESEFKKVP